MIGHQLGRLMVTYAACAAGLVALSVQEIPLDRTPAPDLAASPAPSETRAARAAVRVERMLQEHRCWSGAAPAGAPEPRHALITPPGDQQPGLVSANVGFAIWLQGKPGTLHGFCP